MTRGGAAQEWVRDYVAAPPPTECTVWPFSRSRGYGQIRHPVLRRPVMAARYVWEVAHGKTWPVGLEARHVCGNGASGCVNWTHLTPGTHAENGADTARHGSKKGTRSGMARLTDDAVRDICARLSAGEHMTPLAATYGVSNSTISDVWLGRTWTHVNAPRWQPQPCVACGSPLPVASAPRRRFCSPRCQRSGTRVYRGY